MLSVITIDIDPLADRLESVATVASQSGISDLRKAAATARPWAFLSPELLADVCTRLHDAGDFVRFHAVCTPWREAAPSMLTPYTPRHTFLPWLISQCNGRIIHSPVIYSGRISSEAKPNDRRCSGCKAIVLAEPDASSADNHRNWVGSADGRSAWIFTGGPETTLFDLVTGAVKPLPPLLINVDEMELPMSNPRGIVYSDGTLFLYSFDSALLGYYRRRDTRFKAAILGPGDTTWTVVETWLHIPAAYHSCAAYHGGKVLLWVGAYFWCVVTLDSRANRRDTFNSSLATTWDRLEDEYYERAHSYVLESHGELLWVSILINREMRDDYARYSMASTIAVRVHALEEEVDNGGKMCWVERDNQSLDNHVLFLGSPASFTTNATELGGGCAYFVFRGRMFRYSFIDGEAKPVEWMCPGRSSNKAHLWLRPQQPELATIKEIQERFQTQIAKKQN